LPLPSSSVDAVVSRRLAALAHVCTRARPCALRTGRWR
jgi:hypothetical protein